MILKMKFFLILLTLFVASAQSQVYEISIQSDEGDPVFDGATLIKTDPELMQVRFDTDFGIGDAPDQRNIMFNWNFNRIGAFSFFFTPRIGQEEFIIGPYPHTKSHTNNYVPKINVITRGNLTPCGDSSMRGNFVLKEFEANGDDISKLHIEFDYACVESGPGFRGSLKYNATDSAITKFPDTDFDTIPDSYDNCDDTTNIDQMDSDKDFIGDACDNTYNLTELDLIKYIPGEAPVEYHFDAVDFLGEEFESRQGYVYRADYVLDKYSDGPYVNTRIEIWNEYEDRFLPGIYSNVTRYPLDPGTTYLCIRLDSTSCAYPISGFEIKEVAYRGNEIIKLVLSFENVCTTSSNQICYSGTYKYNSSPEPIISNYDYDEDGISNPQDNCPYFSNIFQNDTDRDTVGDRCDDELVVNTIDITDDAGFLYYFEMLFYQDMTMPWKFNTGVAINGNTERRNLIELKSIGRIEGENISGTTFFFGLELAPADGEVLSVGSYDQTTNFVEMTDKHFLQIDFLSYCIAFEQTGNFEIQSISYDQNGRLTQIEGIFETECIVRPPDVTTTQTVVLSYKQPDRIFGFGFDSKIR